MIAKVCCVDLAAQFHLGLNADDDKKKVQHEQDGLERADLRSRLVRGAPRIPGSGGERLAERTLLWRCGRVTWGGAAEDFSRPYAR